MAMDMLMSATRGPYLTATAEYCRHPNIGKRCKDPARGVQDLSAMDVLLVGGLLGSIVLLVLVEERCARALRTKAPRRPLIAVIGSGKALTEPELRDAELVGRTIAAAGASLVCGGGAGVMEAACRGFHTAGSWRRPGGSTLGVVASRDGRPNPWIDAAIYVHLPGAKSDALPNSVDVVLQSADAVIALPGDEGMALALSMALEEYGIPLMAYGAPLPPMSGIQPCVPDTPVDLANFCAAVARSVHRL